LLYLLVDVVIQFGVERHERFIKEIWYGPDGDGESRGNGVIGNTGKSRVSVQRVANPARPKAKIRGR